MKFPTLSAKFLSLALTSFFLSSVSTQEINTGNGQLIVYNGTTSIGCLDVTGAYVKDNCAIYSDGGALSANGPCDWSNSNKTRNPFVGAPATYAFSCYTTGGHDTGIYFYYLVSHFQQSTMTTSPIIFWTNDTDYYQGTVDLCTGDLACHYAVPTAKPAAEGQQIDFQLYFWDDTTAYGSVPAGWTLVSLEWEPVSQT